MLGNELESLRSRWWLGSCELICAYSSDMFEASEPTFSRSRAREAALKSAGAHGDRGAPEVVDGSSSRPSDPVLPTAWLPCTSPAAVVMHGGFTSSSSKSCSSTDCCGDLGESLGISFGPSAGPVIPLGHVDSLLTASSGLSCKATKRENTCLISSFLSTQFTKWAASDVASTPLVGCAACSPPRLPVRGFRFLELPLFDVLLSPLDGTQQQPLPVVDRPAAGRLRCSRSECSRLHSAKHRKWAGDGWKIQTGTRR
mmetsp:Transcript_14420/g.45160  ORF Transcript_14420/g.45160 Transcript_14420/m.45160 type:complete len:256 (-) Transcript_14420:286-1053(-)